MQRINLVDATMSRILAPARPAIRRTGRKAASRVTISEQATSRDELLQRAIALLPVIAERASEAEELRQIPQATIDDLRDAGLMRIATPARYGGHGTEIDLMFEVAMELGRACGSTAWCYAVWSIHNWMLGFWPEETQDG
jgi:alkylation response protein AidB-like acyl-CoA dehydrogenase